MSETSGQVLIQHLKAQNFLSFGPDNPGIELRPLNVLIGPNGSGKSNLIEAISFMRAAPKNFQDVTRKGGGVEEWIWKGTPRGSASMMWALPGDFLGGPFAHSVSFRQGIQAFFLTSEKIEEFGPGQPSAGQVLYEQKLRGLAQVRVGSELRPTEYAIDRSVLALIRDRQVYPEITWLAESYEKIRIYRTWRFGPDSPLREPQKADLRNDFLEEDFSNLFLFLNRLKTRFPAAKKSILKGLSELYDGITDFDVLVQGGTVQMFFTEGEFSIPATRLSDGTLRYLCLLAILCDPEPPPLICIEEPELGLHPDALPGLADLLREASKRTQLIVTTHSDILVDSMTDDPESVVICEKHNGMTEMKRLSAPDLAVWLEKYRLGQLWIDGQLGGKRW